MNSQSRGNYGRRWRFLALATLAFFIGAGYYFFYLPVQQSKRLEQALIDEFGWADLYTPPADGALLPGRIEGFIRVREAVQSNCATFQAIFDEILHIEDIDSDPEMNTGQKLSEVFGSVKSMFGAAPAFLIFMDARNQALLEEGMGLGEYIYIYLAAYGGQLAKTSESRFAGQPDAYISERTREEFIQVLRNQLAGLDAGQPDALQTEIATTLQAEIDLLQSDADASPWHGGPPRITTESLLPFQPQIDRLYCEGVVRVELMQKNRGMNLGG